MKRAKRIPLILVGHSFGARVVTRAVFSNGLIDIPVSNETSNNETKEECSVDLVVGLQGAFSVRRFIPENGNEGSPYSEFAINKYAKKFVFTWSEYDFANPLAKFFTGANHVGGVYGHELSLDYQTIFNHYEIIVEEDMCNHDVSVKEIRKERNKKIIENEQFEWTDSFKHPEKISIVNASELIKDKPYGKGGNAHSDIYTPGVANFIWECIHNIENIP